MKSSNQKGQQLLQIHIWSDQTVVTRVRVMVYFQQYFSYNVYCGSRFYWWRKPEYPEKTTDQPQITDNLDHIKLYRVHERDSNSQF